MQPTDIIKILGGVLVVIGAVFLFLGSLGITRMPDLYNRMQAGTKATTLGNMLTLIGLGMMEPAWLPKLILIVLFVLVTNPLSSHALARAFYRAGYQLMEPLTDKTVKDEYASAVEEESQS